MKNEIIPPYDNVPHRELQPHPIFEKSQTTDITQYEICLNTLELGGAHYGIYLARSRITTGQDIVPLRLICLR